MIILNIETATPVSSVAVSDNGKTIFEKVSYDGQNHASLLGVFVDEALKAADAAGTPIEAVAVSSGPGSYTGLRIGVSLAKGVCFGKNIPLLSVPTLDILAARAVEIVAVSEKSPAPSLFCAMLDARRMEVYAAIYDSALHPVRNVEAEIVTEDTYAPFLASHTVYFFGSGAAKCKEIINSPNAVFLDDIHPLAANMVALAEQAFADKRFENVAYFEPFYLKEFQATKARELKIEN